MNIGEMLQGALREVAPTVAGAVGGPLAGRVVREVSEALTGRPDAPEPVLREAVRDMGPAQLDAVRALEAEYTERLKIEAGDRASARERHAKVRDWTPAILAYAAYAGFALMLAGLFFVEPPAGNTRLLDTALGVLATLTIGGFAFYHGSSVGSKEKTAIMSGGRR